MCCRQGKRSPSVDACQPQPDETRHCLPSEASALLPNTPSKFSMAYSGRPSFLKARSQNAQEKDLDIQVWAKSREGKTSRASLSTKFGSILSCSTQGCSRGTCQAGSASSPTLMFKWLQGQRTANKSKPNVFLSSPCFLPHVTINRQLYGVEIRTPPLENPQKDRAGVSDSFPLCHVQITKCFCSKLLCKPTFQRSLDGVWAN